MFDADGSKVGSEFRVNTETESNQHQSQIASFDNGGFVVVWTSAMGRTVRVFSVSALMLHGKQLVQNF